MTYEITFFLKSNYLAFLVMLWRDFVFIERRILDVSKIESFLENLGLKLPKKIDYTVGVFYGKEIVGIGSISGNTFQGIGVDCRFQGEGILGKIITHLIKKTLEMDNDEIYVYTKPNQSINFESYGFKKIGQCELAVLLEWSSKGIKDFKESLRKLSLDKPKETSCIVMNGNPMTIGHLELIEKAAKESPWLYIIVVEEDCSLFPYDIRIKLIKEGTKHIKNISIIPGGQYIISSLTFPSYFTREDELVKAHAQLDLDIFVRHIAPELNIANRYVGTEPYCEVTSYYNECMKNKLERFGIKVKEIPRIKVNGDIVSASKVREMIRLGKVKETKRFLPETTYRFVISKEAEKIRKKIKASDSRH